MSVALNSNIGTWSSNLVFGTRVNVFGRLRDLRVATNFKQLYMLVFFMSVCLRVITEVSLDRF